MKAKKPLKKGKVYFVGAGCGGLDSMTVRGLSLLRQADVVIHDYLIDKSLLAEAKEGARLFNCRDLGKVHGGDIGRAQAKINSLIAAKAQEGNVVVRLKNGDPFIFSRTSEEIETLRKKRVAFDVVAGVTSASAAAAVLRVPLTDRRLSSSVVFVTGHESKDKGRCALDWKSISRNGTIVLYMAARNIAGIAQKLIKAGLSVRTPVAVVSQALCKNQKIAHGCLKNVALLVLQKDIAAPSIFIIGKTAEK